MERHVDGTCRGADGAQRAQQGLPDALLDGAVVANVAVTLSNHLHYRMLVERPGCLQSLSQVYSLSHPLVRYAVRPAHACTCTHRPPYSAAVCTCLHMSSRSRIRAGTAA